MKGTLAFLRILAIGAVLVLCGVTAWADPPSQVGRLSYISGFVSFRPGSVDEWAPAMVNYPLTEGDSLWTDADSRAEVHVRSAAIRLDSNTDFSFLSLDDEIVQVRLSEGSLNINVRYVEDGTSFEIDTPNATLSLTSAGSYRVDVQPDGETSLTVRAGRAEVTAGEDAYDVAAGRTTVISGSDFFAYSVHTAGWPDEWDNWNAARDRREEQWASHSRVSRDMIGAEDLDENGTWRNVPGYGPTWAPSHVRADWAPYRDGHWAWVNPWGWTWIDDTSWGFAPFHYGRWAYLSGRWSWIPGATVVRPVYAPALVVFVGGGGWSAGDGIGWFPLGPREAYIPPYEVSTTYVQRINIANVTNITVQIIQNHDVNRVVYVNRSAPRAVTIVPRDVFVQSRPTGRAALTMPQAEVKRAPLMGMTARVAPQRESIVARPEAERAPVRQPPAALLTRRVYSRTAPPPAQVPFVQLQKDLVASPGRPVDPKALAVIQAQIMRGEQRPAPAPVTVVNKTKLTRQVPPVRTTPAPAVSPVVVVKPGVRVQPQAAQPRTAQPAVTTRGGPEDSSAAALIATLKTQTLPDADRRVAEARKVSGIKLDLNAVSRQLAAARTALGGAEKDLAAGNGKQALQKATATKKQVDDLMSQVSAAMQAPVPPARAPVERQKPLPPAAANPPQAPAPAPIVVAKPGGRGQPPAAQPPAAQPPAAQRPAAQPRTAQPAVTTRGGPEDASAAALIATLKTQTLPDADRRVAEARKVSGIKLDLNAVSRQLAAAKTALGGAEKDLAAGNGKQALQKATTIKKQVDDLMSQVSAAMQAPKQGRQKR